MEKECKTFAIVKHGKVLNLIVADDEFMKDYEQKEGVQGFCIENYTNVEIGQHWSQAKKIKGD